MHVAGVEAWVGTHVDPHDYLVYYRGCKVFVGTRNNVLDTWGSYLDFVRDDLERHLVLERLARS